MNIISYMIIGSISTMGGMIAINLLVNSEKRKKYNNLKTAFTFFIVGILVHLCVQYMKLDELYCDKQCILRQK